jgi:hypothetical protein
MFHVRRDGAGARPEAGRDLLVVEASTNQREDIELPSGQSVRQGLLRDGDISGLGALGAARTLDRDAEPPVVLTPEEQRSPALALKESDRVRRDRGALPEPPSPRSAIDLIERAVGGYAG